MNVDAGLALIAVAVVPLAVLWILAVAHILVRRRDLSVAGKGIWMVAIIAVPYLGVLIYAALRPPQPRRRSDSADPTAVGVALRRLDELVDDHDSGVISEEQFSQRKAAIFGLERPTP